MGSPSCVHFQLAGVASEPLLGRLGPHHPVQRAGSDVEPDTAQVTGRPRPADPGVVPCSAPPVDPSTFPEPSWARTDQLPLCVVATVPVLSEAMVTRWTPAPTVPLPVAMEVPPICVWFTARVPVPALVTVPLT